MIPRVVHLTGRLQMARTAALSILPVAAFDAFRPATLSADLFSLPASACRSIR